MRQKILSALLALSLLLPLLSSLTAVGKEEAAPLAVEADAMSALDAQSHALTAPMVETFVNVNVALPDIISPEEAAANQYVGRVRAEEADLHTLVFQNADGTNTMRIFSHPVKYVAADGAIRDISLDLASTSAGYQTADNSIVTTFATHLSDGIRMRSDGIDLLLLPAEPESAPLELTTISTASLSDDGKTVSYPYGNHTTLEYQLTYTGFKEEIVVAEYTGKTEYTFLLQTGGLTPVEADGSWYLQDSAGTHKAALGDILIFTADERNNTFGSLSVETVKANQIYLLTVHVDADWLSDPDTVYPIRIDPSVDIIDYSDGSSAIVDVTINSNAGSGLTSKSLSVGLRESYGIARILMRFPGLDLTKFNSADQIVSVSVGLRDLMCESALLRVYCHAYKENWASSPSWTAQNPDNYDTVALSSCDIRYSVGAKLSPIHRYQFDITAAAKSWKNNPATQDYGVIFKASDSVEDGTTYIAKTIASFNRSAYRPELTVTYTPAISITASATTLTEGNITTVTASVNPAGTTVTWSSSNPSIATVSNTGVVTAVRAGSVTITATTADGESSSIELLVILPSGVYYIQNVYSELYLSTEVKYGNTGSIMQDEIQYTDPEYLASMWKVCHLEDGVYSIRPIHMLENAIHSAAGTAVSHAYNGTTDSFEKMTTSFRWSIRYNDNGYIFTCIGNNRILAIPSNTLVAGTSVVALDEIAHLERHHWNMTIISNPPSGVILYDLTTNEAITDELTRYISIGKSQSLYSLKIAAKVYSANTLNQTVIWESSNENIAKVDANGNIVGLSSGTTIIQGTPKHDSTGEWNSYTVSVPSLHDGFYFLKNRQHNKYVQADDALAPTYTMPGVALEQWEFDGGLYQRWELILQFDGYYRIKSAVDDLYMATQAGGEGMEDLFILQEHLLTTDRQLWKITLTSHGSYKIKAKSSEPYSSDLVMVAANMVNGSSNGIQVQQRLYVDNESYKDEWLLEYVGYYLVNYYDSTIEEHPYQIDYITSACIFVNKIYRQYGISFVIDNVPKKYNNSIADQCEFQTTACLDSCATECAKHHKNIYNILGQFKVLESKHIYIMWTERDDGYDGVYCSHHSGTHTTLTDVFGFTHPNNQTILMMESTSVVYQRETFWSIIFAHEIAHTLGMQDVYSSAHDGAEGYQCIMEGMDEYRLSDYYYQLLNSGTDTSPFCDSCDTTIRKLIMSNE